VSLSGTISAWSIGGSLYAAYAQQNQAKDFVVFVTGLGSVGQFGRGELLTIATVVACFEGGVRDPSDHPLSSLG
jgi:hypothetical protein